MTFSYYKQLPQNRQSSRIMNISRSTAIHMSTVYSRHHRQSF